MKYKIRVFFINTNEEALTIEEVFETKEKAESTIDRLESTYPGKYEYVKLPVKY
jgi:molybdopterin converting factor small subunit